MYTDWTPDTETGGEAERLLMGNWPGPRMEVKKGLVLHLNLSSWGEDYSAATKGDLLCLGTAGLR